MSPAFSRCQIAVQGDHVSLREKLILGNVIRDRAAGFIRVEVIGDDVHAESFRDASLSLTDAPEADDAHGLSLQLDQRIVPVAPVNAFSPFSFMDSLVMVADVMADLKEKSDGELTDRGGSVCRNIHNRNSLFSGVVIVDDIVAGGESRDQLDTRTLVDGLTGDRGLICDDNLGITDTFSDQR